MGEPAPALAPEIDDDSPTAPSPALTDALEQYDLASLAAVFHSAGFKDADSLDTFQTKNIATIIAAARKTDVPVSADEREALGSLADKELPKLRKKLGTYPGFAVLAPVLLSMGFNASNVQLFSEEDIELVTEQAKARYGITLSTIQKRSLKKLADEESPPKPETPTPTRTEAPDVDMISVAAAPGLPDVPASTIKEAGQATRDRAKSRLASTMAAMGTASGADLSDVDAQQVLLFASKGRVLRGVHVEPALGKKKRVFSRVTRVCREVLQPPTNARVSGICHADDHIIEFETASERQQFQHIEDAEGFSTAAKLSYSGFGVSAAAGMSTDSSSSSSSNSSSTTTQYQFSRQMTTVIRFRHVSLDPEALRLAEGPASALVAMDGARMLDAALRDWIDRYGNHVQLDFDLGGHMAMSVTQADSSSSFSSESKESVRKAFSAAAAGGGWGVKASVSVAKESSEASASSSAAASSVSSVNIETIRRGGSPASSTIADFATSLAADYRSWIVVDVGPERYPLWKVAKNTFEGVPAMQKVWLRLKQLTEPSFTGFNIADMVHRIPDARQLKDFIGGEPSKLDAVLGKGVDFAILRERPERAPTAPVRAGGRRPRR